MIDRDAALATILIARRNIETALKNAALTKLAIVQGLFQQLAVAAA